MPMLFRVLGPLEVHAAQVHALGAGKPATVLATLLQQPNAWVAVDHLVEVVWPGPAIPMSAAANLKTYVWQLRRLLPELDGAGRIERRSDAYRLRVAPGEIDADRARDLAAAARRPDLPPAEALALVREALDLWRGRPFCGVESAAGAAATLEEMRLQLREHLAELQLRLGQTQEAVGTLRGVTTAAPLRESAWAHLVRALHAAGRRTEALVACRQAADVLAGELGVPPGPALAAAEREILEATPPDLHSPGAIHAGSTWPGVIHPGVLRPGAVQPGAVQPGAVQPGATRAGVGQAGVGQAGVGSSRPSAFPTSPAHPRPVRSAHTSTRFRAAARRELPRDVRLIGRTTELAAIRRAASGVAPLILLSGPAGIGKTALAVHAAHVLSASYPDGQFFVRMRLPAGVLLDRLLRGVGVVPADMPVDLDEKAALWRSEVARRRILLVLDDAQTRDQVWPLLPANAGTLTVVTARALPTHLDGATRIPLGPLTPAAATALFAAAAGTTDPQAVQAGQGNPAALLTAAAARPSMRRMAAATTVRGRAAV
jgi:DNA-binding SARP family transcriptional activator